MKVTAFKGIAAEPIGDTTVLKVLEKIKNGYWKKDIDKLRSLRGEDKAEFKKNLSGVTFSGTFKKRAVSELIEHSGFICLDFDHVDTETVKNNLIKDPFIYSCWISPSGDGVKALIKIPTDDHYGYFLSIQKRFPDIDESCKDVSRLCFMSYDSELYINENSELWKQKEVKQTYEIQKRENIFEPLTENRNSGLLKSATKLIRNTSLGHSDIYQLMMNMNLASLNPLDQKEFDVVMNNALKYASPDEFNEDTIHDIWKSTYIDPYGMIEKPIQAVGISNFYKGKDRIQRLFSIGNISTITGKQKSKKSFLSACLMAAASTDKLIQNKFQGGLPKEKSLCYYFDTEQYEYDVQNLANVVINLGGDYSNVTFFSLRKFTPKQRYKIIKHAINSVGDRLGYVIIDGIADLLNSVNDEEGSINLINDLMKWTAEYKCHITTVIHHKKGENYATGHLGSVIMKKSESIISMIKIDDKPESAEVESTDQRGAANFRTFEITIDDDGMPFVSSDLKPKELTYSEKLRSKTETPF